MELATIIQQYLPRLKLRYAKRLLPGHHNTIHAMLRCRTMDAGEMVLACTDCPMQRDYPLSCGHRSCPKCQNHEASLWLDRQQRKLLPVEYFHLVFTLDHLLNPLVGWNERAIYNLLFHSAAETLKAFGHQYLGGEIGFMSVLHTWGQTLEQHLHLHCIVPGGGLSLDGSRWVACKPGFFLPVRVLSRLFRRLFLE